MRKVVITGMGVVTPLGDTVSGLFQAQLEGRSGIGPITRFDASCFPTNFAAEVRDFDLSRYVTDARRWANASDASRFAAAATARALADADLADMGELDASRCGVYLGTGEGAQDFHVLVGLVARSFDAETGTLDTVELSRRGLMEFSAGREYEQELHLSTAHIADHFGLGGPNYNCLTACAAGTQAIGEALETIRRGAADLMVTGGAHSMVYPLGMTGFNLLTALSTRNDDPQCASRPFDKLRDGFVLGEGAGILILEELEHARRRRAKIYAEVAGYGCTCDAYRVTDCHPDGRGAAACMRAALADAVLAPEQIGYINAHGTSTRLNDLIETVAIKKVFGEGAYRVPISSSKGTLGHLIGGAGAVELIISVTAMIRGVLPPTMNYEVPDPECDLDYIPNVPREAEVDHVLSNSFGFGGQNASIIASRWHG